MDVKLSATPSSSAAASVPPMLPMPPSTVMAKTRPIYSRPMEGSIGTMIMSSAPARLAVAIPTPKAMVLIWIGFAPMRRSARLSWETPMMALPQKVLARKRYKARVSSTPTTHGTPRRSEMPMGPMDTDLPMYGASIMR